MTQSGMETVFWSRKGVDEEKLMSNKIWGSCIGKAEARPRATWRWFGGGERPPIREKLVRSTTWGSCTDKAEARLRETLRW